MINNEEDGAKGGGEDRSTNPLQDASENVSTEEVKWTRENDHSTQEKGKQQNEKKGNAQEVIYCCHCGNFAVPIHNTFCSHCEILKPTLDDATKKFLKLCPYRYCLSIGIHIDYLHGDDSTNREKKNRRTLKRQELLNKVAALRNTESGHIIIHLVGRNKEDDYDGAFHTFVDKYLEALINDGQQFEKAYKKKNLSHYFETKNYSSFLVLTVENSHNIFTSDFKTKCVTDDNILDIKEVTLRRFLSDKNKFKTDHHEPDFEKLKEENLSLYESREIQLKAIFQNEQGDKWLCEHIFEKLNLLQYVSAFSKNEKGGSYVAGVQEVKTFMTIEQNDNDSNDTQKMYVSKKLEYKPATIENTEGLSAKIQKCLKETSLVCDYEGNVDIVDDLVKITFLPIVMVGKQPKNKFIIIVSVRPVCGLVFFDPEGPVAYMVKEKKSDSLVDDIKQLPFDKWFKAMKQAS